LKIPFNIRDFEPSFFISLREGIGREQLGKDVVSGLIVGIVALPLAIAFAIASGVSPDKGLVTAIIAGLLISVFGGSRVQIGGPTGAFIVIVYSIVQTHGIGGLTIATFMAGFLMIAMGLAKLGNLLKYIPYTLIIGFTSGIALIILTSQIKDFFGMNIEELPADFIGKWVSYAHHWNDINFYALGIAAGTVLITLYFPRLTRRIPGSLVAILLSTLLVLILDIPVDTIESKFGELPRSFSLPEIPNIDFTTIRALIEPAFAIAMLGAIESLLSAVVADGMIGARHNSNMELVAQGGANVFSSLFGGIPATGAIARTATNIRNGGRTPVAGIVHALVLLLIMLLFAPYAKLIPMASLAGILVVVAYHMGEWRHFFALMRGNIADVLVLLTTFFLTVVFDLILAIEVGIVLSSMLFMKRMSDMMHVNNAMDLIGSREGADKLFEEELQEIPKGVVMYEINGPLFFGAAQKFQETIREIDDMPRILILRMRNVPIVDATGIHRLKEVIHYFKHRGVTLILSGVNDGVRADLLKGGITALIPEEDILPNINLCIEKARQYLSV
jgi:sulfate permease, SulP family